MMQPYEKERTRPKGVCRFDEIWLSVDALFAVDFECVENFERSRR
jgi:hypothetical protein